LQAVSRFLGVVFAWMERRAAVLVVVFAAAFFALARWIVPRTVSVRIPALMPPEQISPLLIIAVAIAAGALLVAALAGAAGRKLVPEILLIGAVTVNGLLVVSAWLRLGLLEAAALLTVLLVWRTARSQAAKLTYLAVVLISAGSMIASELLADRGASDWARALLFTSVCIKLAAVPLFFWLLKLADELPALVLGVIIAVVDMAAFGEFYVAAQASPFALTPQALWVYVAVGTSLVASLLMLTQRSLKRLLVLSTAEDVGFLLLGAASMSAIGAEGALVAAATHALAKALLFICLAGPESAGALETEPVALAARYPVSAFGFLFGMLAMLGVPPTLGFIGRWRLYSTALEFGIWPLSLLILSSIFALIAYALALSRNWWGPPPDNALPPEATSKSVAREPFALKAAIVVLAVILVAAGVWPNAWQFLLGVRP
jgi:multicomponent Na+:H+ antiporter subunit D